MRKRVTLLFGCYRRDEAADPEIYFTAAIAVLSEYSTDIVEYVTDARTGLPAKCKFLPSIAEMREFCERIVISRAAALDRMTQAKRQIREREADHAPRSQKVLDGFAQLTGKLHAHHDHGAKWSLTPDELRSQVGAAAFDAIPNAQIDRNWKKP